MVGGEAGQGQDGGRSRRRREEAGDGRKELGEKRRSRSRKRRDGAGGRRQRVDDVTSPAGPPGVNDLNTGTAAPSAGGPPHLGTMVTTILSL